MFTDPIGDMIARIKNALTRGKKEVIVPHSSLKQNILEALVREGYVAGYEVSQEPHDKKHTDRFKKNMIVQLKYFSGKSVICDIRRVSKPSLSVYKGLQNIGRVGNGLGNFILTTSKGVLSDVEARSQHVGGKILLTVR